MSVHIWSNKVVVFTEGNVELHKTLNRQKLEEACHSPEEASDRSIQLGWYRQMAAIYGAEIEQLKLFILQCHNNGGHSDEELNEMLEDMAAIASREGS